MIYPVLHRKLLPLLVLLLVAYYSITCNSAMAQDLDYRAQSLYIYKFTRYISWPEDKNQSDFKIGVYGNSPVIKELQLMASIKKAGNDQNILVEEVSLDSDLTDYNIIYVASSRSRQIRDIDEKIGTAPTLIVAERQGLANKGASINFLITESELLKFEVNLRKLESQNLIIDRDFLKLGYTL